MLYCFALLFFFLNFALYKALIVQCSMRDNLLRWLIPSSLQVTNNVKL